MAQRICFMSTPGENQMYKEVLVDFKYHSGFALSQKMKSIESMHESIELLDSKLKIIEISTKSMNPLGVELSAFNLKFYDEDYGGEFFIENIFQSSKVFQNGGPYIDLLHVHPRDAKRDERLKNSGKLKHFHYNNKDWPLEPKSMFYDWIYINALKRYKNLSKDIVAYNAFTDIEFNHKKSINCQARAAAIFVSLSKLNLLNSVLEDIEKFKSIYPEATQQLKMF